MCHVHQKTVFIEILKHKTDSKPQNEEENYTGKKKLLSSNNKYMWMKSEEDTQFNLECSCASEGNKLPFPKSFIYDLKFKQQYLYRNVLLNVQCLVIRIKVYYYYSLYILFSLVVILALSLPVSTKAKNVVLQTNILEVCFRQCPCQKLQLESLRCWYTDFFFLTLNNHMH